jgi:hypothetical protein
MKTAPSNLRRVLAIGVLLASGGMAFPAPRPVVVELYTSQGCSSCPPADALLGELTHQHNVIALAFHVDYWDDQGWVDRFASPAATQRQQRYGQTLKLASVFTPQVIIDGQRSYVGSDRNAILSQISGRHEGVGLAIAAQGDDLVVDLAPGDAQAGADVLLLAVVPEAQTAVAHGENSGRKLQEFNIVRASSVLGNCSGSAQRFTVPRSTLPGDAKQAVVLVQQAGQRSILGAASYSWR